MPQRSATTARTREPAQQRKAIAVWRPTGSLSRRIIRMVALTAASSMLAGSFLSLYYSISDLHGRLMAGADALVAGYVGVATDALNVQDPSAAEIVTSRIAEASGALSVALEDAQGSVVASKQRETEPPPDYSLLPAWKRVVYGYMPEFRLPDLHYRKDLEAYGDRLGSIHMTLSSAPLFDAAGAHMKPFGFIIFLAALLAAFITRRMRRQITVPIAQLLDTMDHVARTQDYSLKVPPDGPDEIGSLIVSFNEMLYQIHSRNTVLAEHRRKLQALVLERTRNFEAAARDAERSSRAKGDFLARMSHEIRTPMNGVVGMAELLENTGLEQTQHRMLSTMRSSADALLEIINDILDFSKIEAGQLQVLKTDFSVPDLVEEVCDLLSPRAYERGLELICDIESRVPAFANGDPIRLRQIVTNLLGNAVKYTEKGQIIVRVTAEIAKDDKIELRIDVEDTGLGIPEEQLETIFDAFTQGDSFETRKHGGTGLGLAITKQLVTILGGEIHVKSTRGAGSKFWVTLPLSKARRENTVARWDLSSTSILLVQHNEAAGRATTALLEAAGANVWVARTGRRALERLETDRFKLVLIDDQLPDMKVPEFLDRVRSTPASAALPVVMMTTTAASQAVSAEGNIEPDGLLTKPVRRERLRETVDRALGRASAEATRNDATGPSRRLLNFKVLVVEDSPVNREVAAGMLQALGCTTEMASDGALGVECALGNRYDAILMDCQMPLVDGYEATKRIRAGEHAAGKPPTPIIAITANALPGDRERCLLAGMNEFISKPFTLKKLQDMLCAVTQTEGTPAPKPKQKPVPEGGRGIPVLDISQIEELRSLGRPQLVNEAIRLFRDQAEIKLVELQAAVEAKDFKAIAATAHAVKSSALSVGGRRFAIAAGMCEEAARAGDTSRALREAASLRPELAELGRALDTIAQGEGRAA